jgi:hypothetical protein
VAAVAAVPAIRAGIGLRAALLSRFKLQVTELEAAESVANLRQGPTETVSEFLDRVAWSVETKNHTMTEDQKDNDQYRLAQNADIYSFFTSVLDAKVREGALLGYPPRTAETILIRAKNVEAMMAKARRLMSISTDLVGAGLEP